MNSIRDFFNTNLEPNIMIKVSLSYDPPILIMLGRNTNNCPIISFSQIPEENAFSSSRAIDVSSIKQNNIGYRYDLKLSDPKYLDIFFKVIEDLLTVASAETDRKRYCKRLIERYRAWDKFWKRTNKSLSKEEKQGLFGELLYIKDQLNKGIEPDKLLLSWKGPEGAPQDFISKGEWAEIKTINRSVDSITISSLEQLDNSISLLEQEDTNVIGKLIVMRINTTPATSDPMKLSDLITFIRELLKEESKALDLFENGLELLGFDIEKDGDFTAELNDILCFNANALDFPKYCRKNVNNAIVGMTYTLSIPGLSKWEIDYN